MLTVIGKGEDRDDVERRTLDNEDDLGPAVLELLDHPGVTYVEVYSGDVD